MATTKVDVNLISATGTPGSGNFLRGDSTWNSAGTWNIIGTSVASTSASLTITGLDSTYDTYHIALSDMIPATDDADIMFRFGDSSGIDSGASDYAVASRFGRSDGTSTGNYFDAAGAEMILTQNDGGTEDVGNATGEGFGGNFWLTRPGDGTTYPSLHGTGVYRTAAATVTKATLNAGQRLSVITLDRIQVLFNTGNITSGRMTIWGIAHA